MRQRSTIYNPGDVVVVRFKLRDEDRPKPRPAVIVSVPEYQNSRIDAVMIAISARTDRTYFGDCAIEDWQQVGLVKGCKAKGLFRTIEQSKIRERLGHLSEADKARLDHSIRDVFGLH